MPIAPRDAPPRPTAKALAAIGARCSMSREGDPFDNAPMESVFEMLQAGPVDGADYATQAEARRDVFFFP